MLAAGCLGLALGLLYADEAGQKLPDDLAVRALRVRLDQQKFEGQLRELQLQYQHVADPIVQQINHDGHELDLLKAEALKTAKLDDKAWDVDFDKLSFVKKEAKK